MKHREERLQKQREYYQAHRDYYIAYMLKRAAKAVGRAYE